MNRFYVSLLILIAIAAFFVGTMTTGSRAQSAPAWEYLVIDENASFYSYDPVSQTYSNWLDDQDFAAQMAPVIADNPDRSRILVGVYNLLGSYGWEWVYTDSTLHSTYFKRLKQ